MPRLGLHIGLTVILAWFASLAQAQPPPDETPTTETPTTETPTTPTQMATGTAMATTNQMAPPTPEPTERQAFPDPQDPEPSDARVRTTAAHVNALAEGELSAEVEVDALFSLEAAQARPLADAVRTGNLPAGDDAPTQLLRARAEFLRLPPQRRRTLLDDHRARRTALLQARQDEARQRQEQLALLEARAETLELYLAERLDDTADIDALLTLGLADLEQLVETPERLNAFLDPESEQDTTTLDALRLAERRIDRLYSRYAAMDPTQRSRLREIYDATHDGEEIAPDAGTEESDAMRAQAAALEESRLAETESLRRLASEHARLLGVQAAQASYSSRLDEASEALQAATESALLWERRVSEVGEGAPADRLYLELVDELSAARRALWNRLESVRSPFADAPRTERAVSQAPGLDNEPNNRLHEDIQVAANTLDSRAEQIAWDAANVQRDAIVSLNTSRLGLLQKLSRAERASLRGFGLEGVEQGKRELSQISLEARYHVLALPRFAQTQLEEMGAAPVPTFLALVKLLLLLALIRWWRGQADEVLKRLYEHYESLRPPSIATRTQATLVWYLRRIRGPLEWLLLLALVVWLYGPLEGMTELEYVTVVIVWVASGSLVVRLINAAAEHQPSSSRSDDASDLRFRSLRMVGIAVVSTGLILALTEKSVGEGTLYNWVLNTCWVFSLPIIVILMIWWRPTVLARAKTVRNPNALMRWVASRERGLATYPATALGGLYLLAGGIKDVAVAQASGFASTQRFFAYLFRREVEKRAEDADKEYTPLDPETREALLSDATLVSSYMEESREDITRWVGDGSNPVVAIVGERGSGKTTLVDRALEGIDVIRIQCEPGGYSDILVQIALAFGLSRHASEGEILAELSTQQTPAIVFDDAHRLLRPLIGGLTDIDRLVSLLRTADGEATTIFTLDLPAWQYLRRARGDRAVFDKAVTMRPWTEGEITELLQKRAANAGLDPSYDDLVAPGATTSAEETEQTRRDYTRILWDYADGNPLVAQYFFAESLGVRDEQLYVRLFEPPSASLLENLPQTMYFVLRSVVQLELALEPDVAACTDLSPPEVADALRASRSMELVERRGSRYGISLRWFRAVTRNLKRQHLLTETA